MNDIENEELLRFPPQPPQKTEWWLIKILVARIANPQLDHTDPNSEKTADLDSIFKDVNTKT